MDERTLTHATDFRATATDGATVDLREMLAQGPVLLLFMKDGCGTSDLTAPYVERIWDAYREHKSPEGTRLTVLGIAQEGVAMSAELVARSKLTFPVVADADYRISTAYTIASTPTLILVRGTERLREDIAGTPTPAERLDFIEGWSKERLELLCDDVAARLGTLPLELFAGSADVPEWRPG